MPLIVIIGDVRSGKTLLMTALAVDQARELGDGVEIFHNYDFNFEGSKKVEPEDLYKINKNGKQHIILLDEAYAWLESRGSGNSEVNEYLSYILFQSGKDDTTFILTAQLISTIDKRFRRMSNLLIEAERDPNGFIYTFMKPDLSTWNTLYLTNEDMAPYFPFYGTFTKVQPIDENMLIRVVTDKRKLQPEVDKIIKELHAIHNGHWTMGAINAWLRNNRYSEAYGRYVYDEMKLRELKNKKKDVDNCTNDLDNCPNIVDNSTIN